MPLFMDIHALPDISREELARAHVLDQQVEARHGVRYLRYWHNHETGKVYCLVEAPSADAAVAVHREAHGLLPSDIIEVHPLAVEGFLGDAQDSPSGAAVLPAADRDELDPGFRAILFTDIEGSTALTQRLGDAGAMRILRAHDAVVREAIARHRGREVKHTGDGIMAAFLSASAAVSSAIEIQRALARRNEDASDEALRVRIGASAGEPVEDDRDLFGASVQLAARACGHARADQILVSNVVAELCIGKGFDFVDQGDVALKGFQKPVRLHEVRW